MRIPRIYHPAPLSSGSTVTLHENASGHVARVLRLPVGAALLLFNGEGGVYQAAITAIGKHQVSARVGDHAARECESPLSIWLAQGISRGERMDYTLQKAVELGVDRIIPLFTEHCGVQLTGDRLEKRITHWRGVIISACEQCGRNRIPELLAPLPLAHWLATDDEGMRLVLDPEAEQGLAQLPAPAGKLTLLIGPEGGLSEQELLSARQAGYHGLRLGPRILRTETAAVAALAALQTRWGDLK